MLQWTQNGGLANYVIAAAGVASHNVKHALVLAWVASRFAASSWGSCVAFQSFRHRSAVFLDKVLHKKRSLSACLGALLVPLDIYYRKRGSASYIVREVHSVRERERERERERDRYRERDGSDVTIVALKLTINLHVPFVKNSHNWRWVYTFPCQKLGLFVSPFTLPVSPFTERSPLWRWNSQWVHTFRCQKFFRPLCSHSFKWLEPRDEWSKTQDKWSNPALSYIVLPIEKMNQINTKNYWK